MSATPLWDAFEFDPRSPGNASLRASDADRDVAHEALGRAYADGRLTRAEFDERSEAVLATRTLGELPVLLADLVPAVGAPAPPAPPTTARTSIQEQAVARHRASVREALWGFVSASLVCWVIWAVTSAGFPWPIFVMLGTGLHLGRLLVMRQDSIDSERRRLERRERDGQARQRRGLGAGNEDADGGGKTS